MDMSELLNQILLSNASIKNDLQQEIKTSFQSVTEKVDQLSNKVETLHNKVIRLEQQQASTSNVRTTGQLPGKAIDNPKTHYIQAITLRSGKELPSIPKDKPVTEDSDIQVGGNHDEEKDQVSKEANSKPPATQPSQSEHKPQPPFPSRLKKESDAKYKRIFDQHIEGINLKIPLIDALTLIPKHLKLLREAVKEKARDIARWSSKDAYTCESIIEIANKLEKLGDPGTFTIPVSLGGSTFNKCLCDLGASVSLMPLSVAERLGFTNFKPSQISLVLADRSVRTPHGLLEDLPVRVGNAEIPTDFVVIDMGEEPTNSLLLGRPFLASAGMMIDVKSGKIELNLGKHNKMVFDIHIMKTKPTIGGHTFSVEGIDQMDPPSPKRLQVVAKKNSKDKDDPRKNPLYEEVVDGNSLEALFAGNKADNSSPQKPGKLPTLDLGPDIVLKPLGYVNGAMEYKVKSSSRFKPFAKVRQLLSLDKPPPEITGPFEVKCILPCGDITLVGKKGEAIPIDGQRVKLYSVTEPEKTLPHLSTPPLLNPPPPPDKRVKLYLVNTEREPPPLPAPPY